MRQPGSCKGIKEMQFHLLFCPVCAVSVALPGSSDSTRLQSKVLCFPCSSRHKAVPCTDCQSAQRPRRLHDQALQMARRCCAHSVRKPHAQLGPTKRAASHPSHPTFQGGGRAQTHCGRIHRTLHWGSDPPTCEGEGSVSTHPAWTREPPAVPRIRSHRVGVCRYQAQQLPEQHSQ